MEEKVTVKISLTFFLLILAIITIIIMGFFIYKIYTDKQKLDENVAILNSEVTNLQRIINSIQSTMNNDNTSKNTNTLSNTSDEYNNVEINKNVQNDNSKNIIMMYANANIVNFKPGIYTDDLEGKEYADYYNTTYDIYQNGKKIGETKGTVKETEDSDYYIEYENEDFESAKRKVFVSCNYDVIPRKYENVTDIPSEIKNEFYGYDSIKMQAIDLDDDGTKEYVVAYTNDNTASIYLYDSNYKKISMLATYNSYYLSYFVDDIMFMDIDKDGNMEIIINIPVGASYFRFGIYKYENNSVSGQIDIFTSGA